ncbi:MAG TPA: hypothetical protein VN580_04680 [Clostridia bacterium]|nr:hypothetical protein [Clostridia bacterium]
MYDIDSGRQKPAFWVVAIAVIAVAAVAVFLPANPSNTLKPPDTASVLSTYMEQFKEGADPDPAVVTDSVSRKGPDIPENETLRVDSPDGTYRAEAYGTTKGITAAGLYPYEGLRVIRNSNETTVWNGDGYYKAEFLWSGDSRYVAVYREARIYGECFVVDADTGKVIELPDIDNLSEHMDAPAQPAANRPDPLFRAVEWVDGTTIRVNYRWTAQEGAKEVSGTYDCNIISGDVLANTFQISDPPG